MSRSFQLCTKRSIQHESAHLVSRHSPHVTHKIENGVSLLQHCEFRMRGHYHCLRPGCYFVTNITTKLPWHVKKHEKAERRAANGFKYFTKREECGRLGKNRYFYIFVFAPCLPRPSCLNTQDTDNISPVFACGLKKLN